MKNLKNNTLLRLLSLTFIIAFNLFNNVKTAGMNVDDEVILLRNMLKEEREANKARMKYYEEKLGKIAGITMISEEFKEEIPVKEKITSDAHQNLTKMLKKPFLNLLALTALTQPERLKQLVEDAEKALKDYKEKFIETIFIETIKEEEIMPPAEIPAPIPEEPAQFIEEEIALMPEETIVEEMVATPPTPVEIPAPPIEEITPPTEEVIAPIIEEETLPPAIPGEVPVPTEEIPSPIMPEMTPLSTEMGPPPVETPPVITEMAPPPTEMAPPPIGE